MAAASTGKMTAGLCWGIDVPGSYTASIMQRIGKVLISRCSGKGWGNGRVGYGESLSKLFTTTTKVQCLTFISIVGRQRIQMLHILALPLEQNLQTMPQNQISG